jgi:prefoldin subunit 5
MEWMKDSIKLPDGRVAMNLFELMDAIDTIDGRLKEIEKYSEWMKERIVLNLIEGLKMKIESLEKLSHEPQNYREKCDEMEIRIKKVERRLKTLTRYKNNKEK